MHWFFFCFVDAPVKLSSWSLLINIPDVSSSLILNRSPTQKSRSPSLSMPQCSVWVLNPLDDTTETVHYGTKQTYSQWSRRTYSWVDYDWLPYTDRKSMDVGQTADSTGGGWAALRGGLKSVPLLSIWSTSIALSIDKRLSNMILQCFPHCCSIRPSEMLFSLFELPGSYR